MSLKIIRSRRSHALFIGVLILVLSPKIAAEERLRIGYITDLSSQGAYYGKYSIVGAQLAADEIRGRGGALELLVEDHAFQAPKAVTAAKFLIESQRIDALITEFSFITNAVAPIAAKSAVAFLGVSPATSFVESNPLAFKTFLDYEEGCFRIADHWRQREIKKVAVLKAITESGELCLRGTRRVFPEPIVEEFTLGGDVTPQVLRLKAKAPQAIMAPGLESDALNLFRSLQQANWRPQIGFDVRDSLTENVRNAYPELVLLSIGFGFAAPPPSLIAEIRRRAPDVTDLGLEAAALAYLHVHQIWQSFARCMPHTARCAATTLASSSPSPILEFMGWKERKAQFGIHLFRFDRDGRLNSGD